jgi:hypothetical protein
MSDGNETDQFIATHGITGGPGGAEGVPLGAQRCPHGFIHEDLCHACYVANMAADRAQREVWG